MGKIKDQLFTGTELEIAAELSADPFYAEWSEEYYAIRTGERVIFRDGEGAGGDDGCKKGIGKPVCNPVF